MKRNLLISIWMTLATTVLLGIIYPLVVTGLAQVLYPRRANGEIIESRGKLVGSRLIGQPFTAAGYFHSRPSAAGPAGYDPTQSQGSNLAPTNKALLDRVSASVQTLQAENPNTPIPIDLVTASASGSGSGHFAGFGRIPDSASGQRTQDDRGRPAGRRAAAHSATPVWNSGRATRECSGTESRLGRDPRVALKTIPQDRQSTDFSCGGSNR